MAFYIRTKCNFKFLACLTEKSFSAYSPNALNELNLALSQQLLAQHKKLKILSFYTRYYWISQKTISRYCPFKPVFGWNAGWSTCREENIYSECRTWSPTSTAETAAAETLLDRLMRESVAVTDAISRPPLIQGVLGAVPKQNRNTLDIRWDRRGEMPPSCVVILQYNIFGMFYSKKIINEKCYTHGTWTEDAGARCALYVVSKDGYFLWPKM